jgi:formiminoglutamase
MVDVDLFAETTRPDRELYGGGARRDNAVLGETVKLELADYSRADVVLIGCPQDEGVSRNHGRRGAKYAPAEIRRALYKFPVTAALESLVVFDLGDTAVTGELEEIHSRHEEIVYNVLKDGKRLVVIGGGNDISYPDCKGLARAEDDLLAFNIDSHYDVRTDPRPTSGTPYRLLLDENHIRGDHFYEMAIKDFVNAPEHRSYLEEKGVNIYPLDQLRAGGIEKTFSAILDKSRASSIFWGLDVDSVCSMEAPGVSAPNPIGLTADEICRIASISGKDSRTRLVEISELNPRFDIDGRTARLAATMIVFYLNSLAGG